MATYLLAWNPKKSPWPELPTLVEKVKHGETVIERWSCGRSRRMKVGDRVFLIRLGLPPKGIIGSGHVHGEPYSAPHWDDEEAAAGKASLYVDVEVEALLDPDRDQILPREQLNEGPFSVMHWDTQSSGIKIDDSIAAALETRWSELLSEGDYMTMPLKLAPADDRDVKLRTDFLQILDKYLAAKTDPALFAQVRKDLTTLRDRIQNEPLVSRRKALVVKAGAGMGSPANVPWIALLDSRITHTTRDGVYCVFLFRADFAGLYLTFNQGVGRGAGGGIRRSKLVAVHDNAILLRKKSESLAQFGFRLDDEIDLADSGATGIAYEQSTIAYKYYERDHFPNDSDLLADLDHVLRVYDDYIAYSPQEYQTEITSALKVAEPRQPQLLQPKNQPSYTVNDFVQDTGFDRDIIENWQWLLRRKKQIILQGPPGTGKTFVAERLARLLVSDTVGLWDIVQFHPAYSYEDFIQGYHPEPKDGVLRFVLKSGRFLDFCGRASAVAGQAPCELIIDEINRANLSRVFGELMYLFEYRDRAIPLAAGGEAFRIPENVYLVGTMNTADRSIALVDHALRRRFSFVRLNPEYQVLRRVLEAQGLQAEKLIGVLKEINQAIDDANYEIGISFFMRQGDRLAETLPRVWVSEIEPYLEEYFYDQPGKVKAFRWSTLTTERLKDWPA